MSTRSIRRDVPMMIDGFVYAEHGDFEIVNSNGDITITDLNSQDSWRVRTVGPGDVYQTIPDADNPTALTIKLDKATGLGALGCKPCGRSRGVTPNRR